MRRQAAARWRADGQALSVRLLDDFYIAQSRLSPELRGIGVFKFASELACAWSPVDASDIAARTHRCTSAAPLLAAGERVPTPPPRLPVCQDADDDCKLAQVRWAAGCVVVLRDAVKARCDLLVHLSEHTH